MLTRRSSLFYTFAMSKYKLKAQSVMLLRSIIGMPGTAKSFDEVYRAGRLLVVALPELLGKPVDEEIEFEMDGPDRDFCKKAYEFALSKEAVPNTKYSYELVTTLEFVSIPKPPSP